MEKIRLIIWREYWTRVRKKSFLIMSILGPLLIAGFFTLMIWLPNSDKTEQKVMVIDELGIITQNKIPDNNFIKFYYPEINYDEACKTFKETDFTYILHINKSDNADVVAIPELFYKKSQHFSTENYIKSQLESKFYEFKLVSNNIDPHIVKNARQEVKLVTSKLDDAGKKIKSDFEVKIFIGFFCGLMIFISVIIYGMQVMRGVMEEKTNRIIEVIVSSVKPFQLMIGKIIGVAMVGLTQFVIWIILSTVLTAASSGLFLNEILSDVKKMQNNQEIVFKQGSNTDAAKLQQVNSKMEAMKMIISVKDIDTLEMLVCFLIYFLGGYLLYSALFAAIGSAVDSEADTQQFMLPVMLPLILGYVIAITFIQNPDPDSNLAFWGSMIPFTSPIVMMVRLPFGVPLWQIALSVSFLIMGFLVTTWLAAKIYRTGILMYGKKINWKELGKWMFYKG